MNGQNTPAIGVFKAVFLSQDARGALSQGNAFAAVASLPGASAMTLTGPRSVELLQNVGGVFVGGQAFLTWAPLDVTYPDGTYTVSISQAGAADASYPVLVSGAAPTTPTITNLAAARTILNGTPFTLTWEPFTGGTPRDYICLQIESEDQTFSYQTPGIGQPGALSATATAATLTLPPDKRFTGRLTFVKLSQGDARQGATAPRIFGGTMAETEFSLRTIESVLTPVITITPVTQHVTEGQAATLEAAVAAAADGSLQYQWKRNGIAIPGATAAKYLIATATLADNGYYSVAIWNADGATTESVPIMLTVSGGGSSRLTNISSRAVVPNGAEIIPGFVIRGTGTKSILVRAIGPQLELFGVSPAMPDPKLDVLRTGADTVLISNDNWGGGAALEALFRDVGAFALSESRSAAVLAKLPVDGAEGYTVRVAGVGGTGGAVLTEVYDADGPASAARISNLSTRADIGSGSTALVAGFVISGAEPMRVLLRGVGPGLAGFGITNGLRDPQLKVMPAGKSFVVAANDNWGNSSEVRDAAASVGAFPLQADSRDAALVLWLPPGGYSVELSGVGGTSGNAMFEIYDLGTW